MLTLKSELTLPAAGLTGFEAPLTETEYAIQDSVHQFAKNVLRPIGRELDKMSALQISKFVKFLEEYWGVSAAAPAAMVAAAPVDAAPAAEEGFRAGGRRGKGGADDMTASSPKPSEPLPRSVLIVEDDASITLGLRINLEDPV